MNVFKDLHKVFAISLCTATTACGFFSPYTVSFRDIETASLQGETINQTANVSICYNSLYYSAEDADKMAAAECNIIDAKAKFVSTESFSCSLFSPTSATYVCVDPKTEQPITFNQEFRKERLTQKIKPVF